RRRHTSFSREWSSDVCSYDLYDYEKWRANHPGAQESAEQLTSLSLKENYSDIRDFNKDKRKILENLNWLLGEEPAGARAINVGSWNPPVRDWIEKINPVPTVKGRSEERRVGKECRAGG